MLGIPLLKVEASVVLAPAGLTTLPSPRPDPAVRPSTAPATSGRGLAEAVRRIHEGADLLADARRNGS